MQLEPLSQFVIYRQIGDHLDTDRDNYYVQAVIRNGTTSDIIDKILLKNVGNGEYKKEWSVINNTSPFGTWITVRTSVYTDKDCTTLCSKYQEIGDSYLVLQTKQTYGGSIDIDYKKIEKMIRDNKPEQQKEVDLSPVLDAIKQINFDSILKEIKQVKEMIKNQPNDDELILLKLDTIEQWLELNNKYGE